MLRTTGRRDKWLMITTALATPALIAAAVLLPKNPEFAAPSRLALTAFTFAAGIAGLTTFATSLRRYREKAMLARYGISAAVRDTLTYLKNERRLSQRGQLTAFVGSIVSLACYVIAHWPQAAMLAPHRPALGAMSLGFLAATPLLALRQRGHRINAYFLRRYLYQQLDHLGYRSPRWWRGSWRKAGKSSVVVTGFGRFRIGGFELQLDDFVKNALVVGQLGSGKTIAVLNNVLFGLIASTSKSPLKISGLVLDAKGDFYGKLQRLCAQLGRADDLVILDPSTWRELGHSLRSIAWNPADNNDDPLEIATRSIAALRLIGLEQGNEGSFFLDSSKVFIRHALTILKAAQISDTPSFADVYRLALEDEEDTSFYHELIRAISARYPSAVPAEITDAMAYFEQWGRMADRQKSAVLGTLTQLLDEFMVQPFREIFTGKSTISISDIIDHGKILYVHMPASDRERMSRLICTLCKLEFSRQVLLRPKKARPSFFLCDEFQTFYTAGEGRGDSDFFERSRESNHCNIVATQNISAFLKRTHNPKDVMNFLGNCSVKIFLRNAEEETLRWASGLFGQRSEIVVTMNEQAAFEGSWRRRHTTYGRSARIAPRVPPDEFTRLAIPIKGDPMRQHAESIVHLGSRGETEHQRLIWPVNPLE